ITGETQTISLEVGTNTIYVKVYENGHEENNNIYEIQVTRLAEVAPPSDPPPSGGGGGGGGFIPPPSTNEEEVIVEPEDEVIIVEDENGNKTMETEISEDKLFDLLNDASLEFAEILAYNNESEGIVGFNVNFSEKALSDIKNSDKIVKVKFKNVVFSLNSKILETLNVKGELRISTQNIDSGIIKSNEAIKGNGVSNIFDLNIFNDDERLSKINTEIPITLIYNDSLVNNSEKAAVFYFNDETNEWKYVGGKISIDGEIIFKARHFSKYAVREYNKTFEDIQNHWAKNDIEILASKKITNGISETEFAPNRAISNAEFVVLLSRVLNLEKSFENVDYIDVPSTAWYNENLKDAKNSNLLKGSYESYFYPNEPIKRENMANILVNAYFYHTNTDESNIYITQNIRFNDEGNILQSLRNKVKISNSLGLILGDDLGNFNPQDGATRAEVSAVIKRLLKLLELM
ncbi:MAG: S-layer homology domain-containing protein, partial [Bacillota bacterium]|nr:S-layer homology domain-containing protein [Bacillota bacterium]